MITLKFNTTTKQVVIKDSTNTIIGTYYDAPTVKPRDGFYEIMQKYSDAGQDIQIPVCRLPIQNTIMFIKNKGYARI